MKGGGLLLSRAIDETYPFLHKPWPDGLAQAWEISGLGHKPFQASQVVWPSLAKEGRACPGSQPNARPCPSLVRFPKPSGYPLVGSLLEMYQTPFPVRAHVIELQSGHARTLAHWTDQYGDIFEVNIGGRAAVCLQSVCVTVCYLTFRLFLDIPQHVRCCCQNDYCPQCQRAGSARRQLEQ